MKVKNPARWYTSQPDDVCASEYVAQRVAMESLSTVGQVETLSDDIRTLTAITSKLVGILADKGILTREDIESL